MLNIEQLTDIALLLDLLSVATPSIEISFFDDGIEDGIVVHAVGSKRELGRVVWNHDDADWVFVQ